MTNFVLCIHVQIRFASTEKNYSHRLACILLKYVVDQWCSGTGTAFPHNNLSGNSVIVNTIYF